MAPLTPVTWVEERASETPDAPALAFVDGEVSYVQLASMVARRVPTVELRPGSVTPVVVRHDLASIVEVLAVMAAGGCAMPETEPVHAPDGDPGSSVLAIRTSGSSGRRSVVPLTFGNLSASAAASRKRLGTGAGDRWLACLPFDHIGGLSVLFRSFESGGCAVVAPFDPAIGDAIDVLRPSVASMVPTMVRRMLDGQSEGLTPMRWILTGGAATTGPLMGDASANGVLLVPTFGMTEASSQIACVVPGEAIPRAGYVGQPLDGVLVETKGTHARPAPITVEGPTVFGGYLGDSMRSEPFVTSDLGWIDDGGGLTVVGRADDVVVTGGVNVSLGAIEETLWSALEVRDVAVVAVDDEEWGASVCVMVVSQVPIEELRSTASERLPRAHLPKKWLAVDRIPLLGNGKHDAAAIRQAFTGS